MSTTSNSCLGSNLHPPTPLCRKYSVRLGDHSLQSRDEPEQEIQVAQSIQHPCYNSSNPEDHSHDVMLIRMRRSAKLGNKVKAINLTNECPRVGQKCTISGWGTVTSPRGNKLGTYREGEETAGSPSDPTADLISKHTLTYIHPKSR